MDYKEGKIEYVTCPGCGGIASNEFGKKCQQCLGLSLGSFFNGYFLYWIGHISRPNILLRRFKNSFDYMMSLVSFLLFMLGLLLLLIWFWQQGVLNLDTLFFWNFASPLILYFYISIFFLLFFVYKLDIRQSKNNKIKRFKKSNASSPQNWQELNFYENKFNINDTFSEQAYRVIENSYLLGKKYKNRYVDVPHLALSLLDVPQVSSFFSRLDISPVKLMLKLQGVISKHKESRLKIYEELVFAVAAKKVIINAFVDAYKNNYESVSVLSFILPCLDQSKVFEEILLEFKVDREKILNAKKWFQVNDEQVKNAKLYKKMAKLRSGNAMNKTYTAVATPLLDNFGFDLTLAAKWGGLPICVSREKEIENIFNSFKGGSNGILLTGLPGVGKRTIVEGIARRMVQENDIPDYFKDKRLVELDIARLVGGSNSAQAEERLLAILNEVNRAGNIIIYIDNLENIIGISSGTEESLELSEVLSDAIDRKYIVLLSSATDENYIKYIEGKALGNAMSRIRVSEPAGNQAIVIVESKIASIEARFPQVFFSYNAIEAAVVFSSKYIHDKYLPAKAIEILEMTAARLSSTFTGRKNNKICTKNDIAITVNKITDIPTQDIEDKESEKLLNMESEIHKQMINQNEAVDAVANSLRRARVDLREGKRPVASFLFMGPTGVGKTQLAKVISDVYFGDKKYLVRLDMSEYQREDSVNKMIGDSSGVKGYLTEAVREKPFSLILLDEFEKAHPNIFNLFLQVMDDGRLTDGQGKTIDFTNSIIIATSNAGSSYIQQEVIKKTPIENIKEELINNHLIKVMRPELVNRFDSIVVFKPLSRDNITNIAKLLLKNMEKMLKDKGIYLEISERGLAKLSEEGYDPKFGARPLRRVLQRRVENEIAIKILNGEVERRDVIVINEQGGIDIKKRKQI